MVDKEAPAKAGKAGKRKQPVEDKGKPTLQREVGDAIHADCAAWEEAQRAPKAPHER